MLRLSIWILCATSARGTGNGSYRWAYWLGSLFQAPVRARSSPYLLRWQSFQAILTCTATRGLLLRENGAAGGSASDCRAPTRSLMTGDGRLVEFSSVVDCPAHRKGALFWKGRDRARLMISDKRLFASEPGQRRGRRRPYRAR